MIENLKVRIDNFIKNFKKSSCDIIGYHQHVYTKGLLTRCIACEKLRKDGFEWGPHVVSILPKDEKYAQFLESKKLINIDRNLDYLKDQMANNIDYIEYERATEPNEPYSLVQIDDDNVMFVPNETEYDWTDNPKSEGLTGRRRLVHYMYQAYKVEQKKNGKYKLVKAPLADDITLISSEYPFFREDSRRVVYTELEKERVKTRK